MGGGEEAAQSSLRSPFSAAVLLGPLIASMVNQIMGFSDCLRPRGSLGESVSGIDVVQADGGGLTRLFHDPEGKFIRGFAWSPDDKKIVFGSTRRQRKRKVEHHVGDIYVVNSDGSDLTNLTNHPAHDIDPTLSPDGPQIAFTRCDGTWDIYVMQADGGGQARLTKSATNAKAPVWSPDGTSIAFITVR